MLQDPRDEAAKQIQQTPKSLAPRCMSWSCKAHTQQNPCMRWSSKNITNGPNTVVHRVTRSPRPSSLGIHSPSPLRRTTPSGRKRPRRPRPRPRLRSTRPRLRRPRTPRLRSTRPRLSSTRPRTPRTSSEVRAARVGRSATSQRVLPARPRSTQRVLPARPRSTRCLRPTSGQTSRPKLMICPLQLPSQSCRSGRSTPTPWLLLSREEARQQDEAKTGRPEAQQLERGRSWDWLS